MRWPESVLRFGFVPGGEHLVIGDEDVGMTVTGQVDEAQVGVLPVDVRQTAEGAKAIPAGILSARKESWRRRCEFDQIEIAVAREVEELLPSAVQCRQRGTGRHAFDRTELALAEVRLVKPGIGLFAEHTGDALAVKVDPAIAAAVDAGRKVLQTRLHRLPAAGAGRRSGRRAG